VAGADAEVACLARAQLGLVTRRQLLEAGVSGRAVQHRLVAGRLRAVHPGVYVAGAAELVLEQRMLAAVLACGSGAVLSHASAAALWRMLSAPVGALEVVRTGPRRDGPTGVRMHRTHALPPSEVTAHRGVPVTSPGRTLLDLAAGPAARLERALDEAQAQRLVTARELAGLAASGRRGSRALRALLTDAPGFTRSEGERRLRALVRRAKLATPDFNVRLHGLELDAYWHAQRLGVEVDGYDVHAGRAAFERDRARQQELAAHGILVTRVTWRQLTGEPETVVARLAAALATRA